MFGSTRWTRLRPDELLSLGLAQQCFKPLHFEPPEFGGRRPLFLGGPVGQVFFVHFPPALFVFTGSRERSLKLRILCLCSWGHEVDFTILGLVQDELLGRSTCSGLLIRPPIAPPHPLPHPRVSGQRRHSPCLGIVKGPVMGESAVAKEPRKHSECACRQYLIDEWFLPLQRPCRAATWQRILARFCI